MEFEKPIPRRIRPKDIDSLERNWTGSKLNTYLIALKRRRDGSKVKEGEEYDKMIIKGTDLEDAYRKLNPKLTADDIILYQEIKGKPGEGEWGVKNIKPE